MKSGDLEKLQGTWHVLTLEFAGQEIANPGEAKIVIKGDQFTSLSMGATYEGRVTVDASHNPKTLDLKFTKGPEKGNTNYGIYKLTGDRWTICLDTLGKKRPRKFATAAGVALETLSRQNHQASPKPASPKTAKAAGAEKLEPAPELDGEWAMVSYIHNGQPLEEQYLQWGKRVARNNETTVTMGAQVQLQARYTIDRGASPMSMDYILPRGKRQEGIYKLERDLLTICMSPAGKPRPRDFSSTKANGRSLVVWRRRKP